jgi:hypothetical protein
VHRLAAKKKKKKKKEVDKKWDHKKMLARVALEKRRRA